MINILELKKLGGGETALVPFHAQYILSHELTSLALTVFHLKISTMNCLGLYEQNILEKTKYVDSKWF
jgi:hypothetical protein